MVPPRPHSDDACEKRRVERRVDFVSHTARPSRALRPPPVRDPLPSCLPRPRWRRTHAEGEIAGEPRWFPHGPLPTTRARSGGWSGAWISGLTRPGQAGPYAHHLDAIRRGEACLALVGEEPMPRVRSRG